ncbi:MAG: cytochrome C oxidase subunit I [Ginsengibacter sp.]|jgi:hypothetical protein
MVPSSSPTGPVRNTPYQVVLPFYIYATLSFLVATILLFLSSAAFTQHYFHPQTLAITHIMALGWGTMMILGASHQLVPVLIEGKLHSNTLGYLSFITAGIGIPLLVYSFYHFFFGWSAQWGAILINIAILIYICNIAISMSKSKKENIHAVFVFTAALWLLITIIIGLLLVYNYTYNILSYDSLHYLSFHAHIGIVGWFLLTVLGIGSRLIPMFLISKYNNVKLLKWIYGLVNFGLISFIIFFLYLRTASFYLIPIAAILIAIILFAYFCRKCYKERIRRKVDDQIKMSLFSIGMMGIPLIFLIIVIASLLWMTDNPQLVLAYGFCIFFGWITAIIFGMTFKTLPFILWNKTYHTKAGLGKTPNPRELFSNKMFLYMAVSYLTGFVLFAAGILIKNEILLKVGAGLLVIAAVLYNGNVFKMAFHQPKKI